MSTSPNTIVIEPVQGWGALNLREIWAYRDLMFLLFWRDLKGRYQQMAFGPIWVIVQPFVNMVVLSFIFGRLADLPSEGVPYPIFIYVALLPWRFFSSVTRGASGSLLGQKSIIAKVYFPRLIVPMVTVLAAVSDFLITFLILLGLIIYYQVELTWTMLLLPLFLLVAAISGLAVGLWTAGLNIKFRDVAIGVGFGLSIWQYLTPVAYSATLIPDEFSFLYKLNPMTGVVQGFRWAVLGVGEAPDVTFFAGAVAMLILMISGAYYFRRVEQNIVDLI